MVKTNDDAIFCVMCDNKHDIDDRVADFIGPLKFHFLASAAVKYVFAIA